MVLDRVRSRAPTLAVLVAALLAFVASSLTVTTAFSRSKKADASIEAARLATMQLAKPTPRKVADGGSGAAALPRLVPVAPAWRTASMAPPAPSSWAPSAKTRAQLMVFLI